MKKPAIYIALGFVLGSNLLLGGVGIDEALSSEVDTCIISEQLLDSDRHNYPFGATFFDLDIAEYMLNWQGHTSEKPLGLLRFAQEGKINDFDIILSGAFWGSYMYEKTNVAGKFPILSRFPSQHGNLRKSGEEWIVNNAAFGVIMRGADWFTAYLQPEFTDIEFPGQNDWQLRKAYLVVGNLEKFPAYLYFGRNTVDFGWNDAYNPFTHSVPNHFYRVDSEDPVWGLGFYKNGFHLIGTLIHSGRQLRVADTDDKSGWDNGAVFASYNHTFDDLGIKVGGGYLHSTIYNRDIAHHPGENFGSTIAPSTSEYRNAAVNGFAELVWRDSLRAGFEYTTTLKDWPTTKARVEAYNIQAAYDFPLFSMPTRLSAVFGFGKTGPDGTEYENLSQFVLGLEIKPMRNVAIGLEYVHNESFVPLFGITQASDKDVATDTFIAGVKITY